MRDAPETPPISTSDVRPETGPSSDGDITRLLGEVAGGDATAEASLFDRVYHELHALAHARLRMERRDATLSTTGLIHEAYLKLLPLDGVDWQDRAHFFATASRAMRRVLIDRARAASRLKRGGGQRPVSGVEHDPPDAVALSADDLLALDEALERLGSLSSRQLRVVELRFFAGLSITEIAEVLGVAANTVKRDWSTARVWLNRELAG
jgi:RNA polymerase sigma factor (TIGR02999 family)